MHTEMLISSAAERGENDKRLEVMCWDLGKIITRVSRYRRSGRSVPIYITHHHIHRSHHIATPTTRGFVGVRHQISAMFGWPILMGGLRLF
jgi:hypothetical protein